MSQSTSQNTLALAPYHLMRPEKVEWIIPHQAADPLKFIKSKSLRKFLTKVDTLLEEHRIRWQYQPISFAEFQEWLPYYQAKMTDLGYDIIASTEWYRAKLAEDKTVEAMMFYQDNRLVCSGIFTKQGKQKAVFAFKASERLNLSNDNNSSIGAVVDYFFLREMANQQVSIISAGRSRNAFGVVNSFGYLAYKLRFGYEPHLPEPVVMLDGVPTDAGGIAAFFAHHLGLQSRDSTGHISLSLYVLKPAGIAVNLEAKAFLTTENSYQEIEY